MGNAKSREEYLRKHPERSVPQALRQPDLFLQVGYERASIIIQATGNVTPETLRYLARFCLFQAETMEVGTSAAELEYVSWFPVAYGVKGPDHG